MEFISSSSGCVALLWAFLFSSNRPKSSSQWLDSRLYIKTWVTEVGPATDRWTVQCVTLTLAQWLLGHPVRQTFMIQHHTENRLKYWDSTTIPVKRLMIIILLCVCLWERTPGPSADPDRFSPFVHVTLPGPVLCPGTWNLSALMSSCSIRYICAKLFIVGCGAAIVLFCSLHGAKSQFTGEPWAVCIDEWDLLLNRIASN